MRKCENGKIGSILLELLSVFSQMKTRNGFCMAGRNPTPLGSYCQRRHFHHFALCCISSQVCSLSPSPWVGYSWFSPWGQLGWLFLILTLDTVGWVIPGSHPRDSCLYELLHCLNELVTSACSLPSLAGTLCVCVTASTPALVCT